MDRLRRDISRNILDPSNLAQTLVNGLHTMGTANVRDRKCQFLHLNYLFLSYRVTHNIITTSRKTSDTAPPRLPWLPFLFPTIPHPTGRGQEKTIAKTLGDWQREDTEITPPFPPKYAL